MILNILVTPIKYLFSIVQEFCIKSLTPTTYFELLCNHKYERSLMNIYSYSVSYGWVCFID